MVTYKNNAEADYTFKYIDYHLYIDDIDNIVYCVEKEIRDQLKMNINENCNVYFDYYIKRIYPVLFPIKCVIDIYIKVYEN